MTLEEINSFVTNNNFRIEDCNRKWIVKSNPTVSDSKEPVELNPPAEAFKVEPVTYVDRVVFPKDVSKEDLIRIMEGMMNNLYSSDFYEKHHVNIARFTSDESSPVREFNNDKYQIRLFANGYKKGEYHGI